MNSNYGAFGSVPVHPNEEVKTYQFIKEGKRWYIDLPAYLEQGGFAINWPQ